MWAWWFGPTLEDRFAGWKRDIRAEMRVVDRELQHMQRAEAKIKADIKVCAKTAGIDAARLLARELVGFRRGLERLYETRAQLRSVLLQLGQQQAQLKVAAAISQSAQATSAMNAAVRVPVIRESMQRLAREMYKVGYIGELIDGALDDPVHDDEADDQVARVLDELVAGLNLPTDPMSVKPVPKEDDPVPVFIPTQLSE